MSESTELLGGEAISVALDPHRRSSVQRALQLALKRVEGAPRVALVGFQAATFLSEVVEKASEVVIVEGRPEVVERLQRAVVAQGLGKKVKIKQSLPATAKLEEKVDVAVYLPQSTWMMEGPDAAVLANIREKMLNAGGVLIPRRVVQLLELAQLPAAIGGISLREPRFSRAGEPVATLSESKHFVTTEMGELKAGQAEVDDTIIIRPLVGGEASGLRLSSMVELVEGVIQTTSESGVKSILVPFRESLDVKAGQPVSIRVRYRPGEGLGSAKFSARVMVESESEAALESEHPVVSEFQASVQEMMAIVERKGRGSDLDRVVNYTRQPHGDVSRLTALFWSVDEEFRRPLRKMVESFRREASQEMGRTPSDEAIYDWMYEVYRREREG